MPRLAPIVLALAALPLSATAQLERYRLTVDCTWSTTTHPGLFPPDAHFSWVGGGTHGPGVSFWSEGALASFGMVQMAETGATYILEGEVATAVANGTAGAPLGWHHWFCPAETPHAWCGDLVVEFDVDPAFPLVTLASMLGPSPDWFVGVHDLPLHDGVGWIDQVVVDLHPYDAGSRSLNAFQLLGPQTVPQEPIALITAASGQLIGPSSLGTFTFERVAALAAVDVRNGTDVNPIDYTAAAPPVLGEDWHASISLAPTVGVSTLLTVLALSEAGPTAPLPLFGGELLVLPPVVLDVQLGAHVLALPFDPALAGGEVATQGMKVELLASGDVELVLTNALDLVFGY